MRQTKQILYHRPSLSLPPSSSRLPPTHTTHAHTTHSYPSLLPSSCPSSHTPHHHHHSHPLRPSTHWDHHWTTAPGALSKQMRHSPIIAFQAITSFTTRWIARKNTLYDAQLWTTINAILTQIFWPHFAKTPFWCTRISARCACPVPKQTSGKPCAPSGSSARDERRDNSCWRKLRVLTPHESEESYLWVFRFFGVFSIFFHVRATTSVDNVFIFGRLFDQARRRALSCSVTRVWTQSSVISNVHARVIVICSVLTQCWVPSQFGSSCLLVLTSWSVVQQCSPHAHWIILVVEHDVHSLFLCGWFSWCKSFLFNVLKVGKLFLFVWYNLNPLRWARCTSTQYTVSWCLFQVFCLYHARRGLVKSSLYGSLFSLSIGFTAVWNTVCLSLLEFCPPGINPEFVMECKLIAHPVWEMYSKKLSGINTLSWSVGSMGLRPEWPWRARR